MSLPCELAFVFVGVLSTDAEPLYKSAHLLHLACNVAMSTRPIGTSSLKLYVRQTLRLFPDVNLSLPVACCTVPEQRTRIRSGGGGHDASIHEGHRPEKEGERER